VLQLASVLNELRNNFAELPLDGPLGWLLIVVLGVLIPVGPWLLRWSVGQFQSGYAMLANTAVGAGEAHQESGIVEVEGTAVSLGETISGKYSDEPTLAQKWHREREEEQTDSDGNTTTSWRRVGHGSNAVPFLVEDETGTVAVEPSGASLSISESHIHRSPSDIRHYEGRIEPGDSVYVYGQLLEADDPAEAPDKKRTYIGNGDEVAEFVVSDSGQLGTVFDYFLYGAMMTALGLALTLIIPLFFLIAVEEVFGVPAVSWLFNLI
jgi:hypothetical protein